MCVCVCMCSRDSLSHNDCCHPGSACLSGIHRCLSVESKDGRHHYAAHSSTAKIRAGRLADSTERKSKTPKRPQAQFCLRNFTLPVLPPSPRDMMDFQLSVRQPLVVLLDLQWWWWGGGRFRSETSSRQFSWKQAHVSSRHRRLPAEDHVGLWSCNGTLG